MYSRILTWTVRSRTLSCTYIKISKQTGHQSGDQFFSCIGVKRQSASIYHTACLKKCTPAAESSVSHTEAIVDRKRQWDSLGVYCFA